jgi:repressor LexA
MEGLTKKQKNILLFVKEYVQKNLYQPTRKEIGDKFDVTGVAITHHMKALEKKGYIKRIDRRSIKFLKEID